MLKTVIFDLYRTLIDIRTDEGDDAVYETVSRFLSYHLIRIDADELRSSLFGGIERSMRESNERHPETDVFKVFDEILTTYGGQSYDRSIIADVAMLYRSLTIRRFGLFPAVPEILSFLSRNYRTGLVSDAQWVYTDPEIAILGLERFFGTRIISSRLGFKKPDPRLFCIALKKLDSVPESSVYIGDNPDRDLLGARGAGMRCILFDCEHKEYQGLVPDGVFRDYRELPGLLAGL